MSKQMTAVDRTKPGGVRSVKAKRARHFEKSSSRVDEHDFAVFDCGDDECFHILDRGAVAGLDTRSVDLDGAGRGNEIEATPPARSITAVSPAFNVARRPARRSGSAGPLIPGEAGREGDKAAPGVPLGKGRVPQLGFSPARVGTIQI